MAMVNGCNIHFSSSIRAGTQNAGNEEILKLPLEYGSLHNVVNGCKIDNELNV